MRLERGWELLVGPMSREELSAIRAAAEVRDALRWASEARRQWRCWCDAIKPKRRKRVPKWVGARNAVLASIARIDGHTRRKMTQAHGLPYYKFQHSLDRQTLYERCEPNHSGGPLALARTATWLAAR